MGGAMALHLHRAGGRVVAWNRSPERGIALRKEGVSVVPDLATLAGQCSVIMLCVNRSEDVREVLSQMVPVALPGTLIVDHSTISPVNAKAIHQELQTAGLRFVDAPITGGSVGAQNGTLTVFLGGDERDTTEAAEIIRPYSKRAERVGGPGAGQMAKMVNQIAVGAALLGLCEALSFAEKAGLDLAQMRDMVGGGAGGSWAFEHYGPKILRRDWTPGFSVKNQRKDFGYCFEAARAIDAALPSTRLADELLAKLDNPEQAELATVALYEAMLKMSSEA